MDNSLPESSQGDILIVDDEMTNLRVLANMLCERGYQVRSARDGVTALMIAAADPPDLILLDVKMPEMDGIETCQRLKSDEVTSDIPVIFVSGLDEIADQVRGFEAGGVDYITKPFQLRDVEARVQTHLKLHQLQSELKQTNRQLNDRVRELLAINRIAQLFATLANLSEALSAAAAIITELFGNRLTLILVPNADERELQIVTAYERGLGPVTLANPALPLPQMPISSRALASGQTTVVMDMMANDLAPPVRDLVESYDLHVGMIAPMKVGGRTIGTLTISLDNPQGRFSSDEILLAETIAGKIAGAIENARLTEQSRSAAIDAERQRLARELHDSVTQSLYSVILLSSGWQSMAEQGTLNDPAAAFRQLGEVGLDALREMRLLIHQLRPPILEEIGLVRALQQRLDFVELRANIKPELTSHGDVDSLPPNIEEELFYIAQEALNNTLRHAIADEVSVHLERNENDVSLIIRDDGQGFDLLETHGGMGLMSMRERTEGMHGEIKINTGPDIEGTTVTINVPLVKPRKRD